MPLATSLKNVTCLDPYRHLSFDLWFNYLEWKANVVSSFYTLKCYSFTFRAKKPHHKTCNFPPYPLEFWNGTNPCTNGSQEENERLTSWWNPKLVKWPFPYCFHYHCRNIPKGERSHLTHWTLKTIAVLIMSLMRMYNFPWLPTAYRMPVISLALHLQSKLTSPIRSALPVPWPSHAVHCNWAATSPSSPWCVSLPLVSEVLLLLLPWAGIPFLTFFTGKAHSCFKVHLKCHFLRRGQASQDHVGQTGFSSLGFLCSYILSICPHEDKLRFRLSKLSQSYLSESYYLIYLLAASLQT